MKTVDVDRSDTGLFTEGSQRTNYANQVLLLGLINQLNNKQMPPPISPLKEQTNKATTKLLK